MSDIKEQLEELIKEGKKFPVIYADVPAAFKAYSDKGLAKAPEAHYKTMSKEELKLLPIKEIAEKDAILYYWVYQPVLPEVFEIFEAWGFKYVTIGHVWNKTTKHGKPAFGTGYYTRTGMEMCLIARRGNPPRPKVRNCRQVFSAPVRAHSQKPDELYTFIESMYDGPYLELFARNTPRIDWTKIGNEVGKIEDDKYA